MSGFVKKEIEIVEFKSVYYFEHGKEFYHAPEQHNFWEIVYVDKGEIIAVTDGIGRTLTEGEVIFHEPNDVHSHISNHKVANNMFVVSFVTESEAMDFFRKKVFKLNENSKRLLSLFLSEAKNALGEVQGDYKCRRRLDFSKEIFGSTQLMASHLEEFLIKLIRSGNDVAGNISYDKESRRMGENSTARLIEEYLCRNIYEELNLSSLCERFFIGKSKLSQIFKENTGKSPMQYLSELRIEESKKLIREGVSIGEIAELLHYSSIHSYTRAFKNATGFAPTGYKNSIF